MNRLRHLIALGSALSVLLACTPTAHAAIETSYDNDTNGMVPGPRATDRNYTFGTRTAWYGQPGAVPRWSERVLRAMGADRDFSRSRLSLAAGQELYTPDAISSPHPIRNDRPYAAWLYAGATLSTSDDRHARALDVRLGMVGPDARGNDVQTWWHRRNHIRLPRGWRHQIANEPGLRATLDERWRPLGYRRFANVVPHAHVTVGNVLTEAGAGATLQLGLPLADDFGPGTPPGPDARARGMRLYAFARGEGRAVARDIFLDGNTFSSSMHVHRVPFVTEAQAGLGVRWGSVGVRYTFSYTSRQFRERDDYQEYGSVGVAF
jgi:hypothetical protein